VGKREKQWDQTEIADFPESFGTVRSVSVTFAFDNPECLNEKNANKEERKKKREIWKESKSKPAIPTISPKYSDC
jgi:hypothetical protein